MNELSNPSTLTAASREWASRPDDERFLNLPELHAHCIDLRERSASKVVSSRDLTVQPQDGYNRTGLVVTGANGGSAEISNYAFGQLASLGNTPAGFVRTLPAPLAADCINYGLKFRRDAEDVGILLTRPDGAPNGSLPQLRAATGPRYGRIWNSDITEALMDRFGDGRTGDWRIPGEFGKQVDITLANTTLYAGDRDMFVFLADEENRIEIPNRRDGQSGGLARGFFVWNSEVGSKSLGLAFFLFDFVCMNRMVWGVEQFQEHRIRHSVSAPDRWLEEIAPVLVEYANASAEPVRDRIIAAQAAKLTRVDEFLAKRFSARQATTFMEVHQREEGRPIETMWDAVTAITAHAKTIEHQDLRVELERKGGALLDLVA